MVNLQVRLVIFLLPSQIKKLNVLFENIMDTDMVNH